MSNGNGNDFGLYLLKFDKNGLREFRESRPACEGGGGVVCGFEGKPTICIEHFGVR